MAMRWKDKARLIPEDGHRHIGTLPLRIEDDESNQFWAALAAQHGAVVPEYSKASLEVDARTDGMMLLTFQIPVCKNAIEAAIKSFAHD